MQINHLPLETVNFINSIYRLKKGMEINLKEVQTKYRDFIARTSDWFETRKQVVISSEEPVLISNLQYLFQKREDDLNKLESSGYDTEAFETYIKTEFDIGESLTRLNAEREKQQISPIPIANDFLLAAWAHINKEAPVEVVMGFMPLLKGYLANLENDYNGVSHILKPEVKKEFANAFDLTKRSVNQIEDALKKEDKKELDIACDYLKEGFNLLNYYLEWHKKQDESLIQQFSRFKIPFIAHDLEILLLDAKEGRTDKWSKKIEIIKNTSLPELLNFWEQVHTQIFIKPSQKQKIVENINDSLQKLEECINILSDLTPEHVKNYENCLENLSELFSQLEHETLRWDNLIGTGGELLGECVKGIYYGTLPDFTLRDVTNYLKTSPLVSYFEEGINELEAYLEDFQKEHLLWGLEKLLAAIPQKAEIGEAAAATVLCPYCGSSNLQSQSYCIKCNARLMFKGAIIMESESTTEDSSSINIMDLPLPSTAEPLVRLLHKVEQNQYTIEEAEVLINNFIITLNQTISITKGDRLLKNEQQEKLIEILNDFANAAQEAQQFLDSHDPETLRRCLKKVSEASIKAKKHADEEADRIAKQEVAETS